MTTIEPLGRLRPSPQLVARPLLLDVVADALALFDGVAIADPETENRPGAEALPSDEQEFAAPPGGRR